MNPNQRTVRQWPYLAVTGQAYVPLRGLVKLNIQERNEEFYTQGTCVISSWSAICMALCLLLSHLLWWLRSPRHPRNSKILQNQLGAMASLQFQGEPGKWVAAPANEAFVCRTTRDSIPWKVLTCWFEDSQVMTLKIFSSGAAYTLRATQLTVNPVVDSIME